ncbi:hypothetical protein PIB30_072888 [Stylosanthes scabra]|uniref:Uncharacterized protein n=1 Tax=Stylosanthes scabra TaxID=79078 RepID=A0ABU6WMG6_9FABA|nr:hypothetical protein [Stylosanthes scabra]
MLEYAKSKFTIPSDGEPWVLDTIGELWKQFKKQENLTCEVRGLRSLVKVLFQQVNPDMNEEQLQVMIEAAQQYATDVNSVQNGVRQSIPPLSGSSHIRKDVDINSHSRRKL